MNIARINERIRTIVDCSEMYGRIRRVGETVTNSCPLTAKAAKPSPPFLINSLRVIIFRMVYSVCLIFPLPETEELTDSGKPLYMTLPEPETEASNFFPG